MCKVTNNLSNRQAICRFFIHLRNQSNHPIPFSDDGLLVHIHFGRLVLTIVLFVIGENLFEFLVKFFHTCNPAGQDGAVGGEENLVGNPGHSINAHGLGFVNLGKRDAHLLHDAVGFLRVIADGDTDYFQPSVLVFLVQGYDMGHVSHARPAPRGPEIGKHIIAPPHKVGNGGRLTIRRNAREFLEHLALFGFL